MTVDTSVIIVAHNHRAPLLRCLEELEAGPADEIIVVDNDSRDGTATAVEGRFPSVHLIMSGRNLGFAGGANLGAAAAGGEMLVFLNPDTVVAPGWLDALVAALAVEPDAGLATPRILLSGRPRTVNACGTDVHLSGLTLCRGLGMPACAYDAPAEVGAVSGAAFAVRRELYEVLGGLDAAFFLYMEEVDLSWRARLAGFHSIYVPSAVVYHDYRPRLGPRKLYLLERNRYWMLLKTLRWRTLVRLLPVLLLAELVVWAYVLRHRPAASLAKIAAYGAVLWRWGDLMARRGEVQARRRVGDDVLLAVTRGRLAYEQVDCGAAARIGRRIIDPLFLRWRERAAAGGGR
jgi:GT2 family glycosyltransferase